MAHSLGLMGRSSLNLLEDERVANEVKKYPCLYKKSDPTYKDKRVKINAWRKVEEELGHEEGVAEKLFENLKKRYSKKRTALEKLRRSGAAREVVAKAEDELTGYDFLSFLSSSSAAANRTLNTSSMFSSDINDDDFPNSSQSSGSSTSSDEFGVQRGGKMDSKNENETTTSKTAPRGKRKMEKSDPFAHVPIDTPSWRKDKKKPEDVVLETINKRLGEKNSGSGRKRKLRENGRRRTEIPGGAV